MTDVLLAEILRRLVAEDDMECYSALYEGAIPRLVVDSNIYLSDEESTALAAIMGGPRDQVVGQLTEPSEMAEKGGHAQVIKDLEAALRAYPGWPLNRQPFVGLGMRLIMRWSKSGNLSPKNPPQPLPPQE